MLPSRALTPDPPMQVGYMQGMGFIAAVLLLHMPMEQVGMRACHEHLVSVGDLYAVHNV